MRPRITSRSLATRVSLLGASIILAFFLVVGFRTPDEGAAVKAGTGTTSDAGSSPAPPASAASGAGGGSSASSGATGQAPSSGDKTVTGPVESTRYGPVQVQVTLAAGKIISVTALELPSGGRSGAISYYVGPILSQEAVAAQGASIDTISGATYTSRAYAASLQAALDQAGS